MSRTYTVPELAEYFGTNQAKVVTWIRDGELIAVNIAQTRDTRAKWRVTQEELDRFILSRSSRPAANPAPRRRRRSAGSSSVPQYV